MNLKKFAALLLVVVLCLFSVSALAATEEEYEERIAELEARIAELEHQLAAKDYVAEFDGGYVTVEEAMEQYDYISYMYSSYGYSISGYEDTIKNDILNTMVEEAIVRFKAEEMGMYELTEEKEAELMEAAQADLDSFIETYRDQFETSDVAEETIIQATTEYLAQNGITLEGLYEDNVEYYIYDAMFEHVAGTVELSDDDVMAKYNALVNQDQISYAGGSSAYEYALMNSTPIYWHPAGFRNVSQVLVKFDDDQSARYTEITDKLDTLNAEMALAEAETEPAEGEEAEEGRSIEDIQADLTAAEAELDALYAELQPTADEVYAKFEEGTPIEELIATYGGDPGSINDDGTVNTYAVSIASTSYDTAFKDAAMSIENIGELSEPANGMYGIYIVYYDSDVVSGAVEYESVKDEIYNTTLDDARSTAYEEQIAAWKEELNVVTYIENFR